MCVELKFLVLATLLAFVLGAPSPKKIGYGPGQQDWGWMKVRDGAHMFYWLYYTTASVSSPYDRPLVIWLQGGPGVSSTGYGNFLEIGTLQLNGSRREYAWTKNVNVLYIDNPVGTGFSYVEDDQYAKDNAQIAADMVVFLTQFYAKYSDFRKVPTYVFGESYGGKMAVQIAVEFERKIRTGGVKADFRGVALVDSWISPADSAFNAPPLLLHMGFVDDRGYATLSNLAGSVKKEMDAGDYQRAMITYGNLMRQIDILTGGIDVYNILTKVKHNHRTSLGPMFMSSISSELEEIHKLMNGPVRNALNIPKNIIHGAQFNAVYESLMGDFLKPVTDVVEHLLNDTNLQFVVMNGQLDLIVDTYGTVRWVEKLRWKGRSEWASAKRLMLVVNDTVEGYVTQADRLSFYWVDRSGHMVPMFNPPAAMEILRRLTKFDELEWTP